MTIVVVTILLLVQLMMQADGQHCTDNSWVEYLPLYHSDGGHLYNSSLNLAECQASCVNNITCTGIDFDCGVNQSGCGNGVYNSSKYPKCKCWTHFKEIEKRNTKPCLYQFVLKRCYTTETTDQLTSRPLGLTTVASSTRNSNITERTEQQKLEVTDKLESLWEINKTNNSDDFSAAMSTISNVTTILEKLLDHPVSSLTKEFVRNGTINILNLINDNYLKESVVSDSSELSDLKQLGSLLMGNMETITLLLAKTIGANQTLTINSSNVFIEISDLNGRTEIEFPPSMAGRLLNITTTNSSHGNPDDVRHVIFIQYNTLHLLFKPSGQTNVRNSSTADMCNIEPGNQTTDVDSKIFSASIEGDGNATIQYQLQHSSTNIDGKPSCGFWSYGSWSSEGCRVLRESNATHTTCECDHLTNFAILMSVTSTPISESHRISLSVITYVGCGISLVCLVLSFITFAVFRKLQSDRNTIHKNLVLNLFVAELVFFCGIVPQPCSPMLCSIIAIILHYFFLSAFSWMCLEGIQLYVLLVEVFEAERSRLHWYYAFAYGLPAVVVGISAGVAFDGSAGFAFDGYGTKDYCWLSVENGLIWAFVGPVICILILNTCMLSITIYTMCKLSSNAPTSKHQSTMENISSWIKAAVVLVVLLGSTWVFGLFYVNQQSIAMAYIFTVCNSLQGFFIFVCHCLMSEKVRKQYRKYMGCCLNGREVPYGSASLYGMADQSGKAVKTSRSFSVFWFSKKRNRLERLNSRMETMNGTSGQMSPTRDLTRDINTEITMHSMFSRSRSTSIDQI